MNFFEMRRYVGRTNHRGCTMEKDLRKIVENLRGLGVKIKDKESLEQVLKTARETAKVRGENAADAIEREIQKIWAMLDEKPGLSQKRDRITQEMKNARLLFDEKKLPKEWNEKWEELKQKQSGFEALEGKAKSLLKIFSNEWDKEEGSQMPSEQEPERETLKITGAPVLSIDAQRKKRAAKD